MTINLEVNDKIYEGFTNGAVTKSMDSVAGIFQFAVTQPDNINVFPIKKGSSCRIYVDEQKVIDGYIQNIRVSYDDASHEILIIGADKTIDIVESSLTTNIEFNASISLKKVIENVVDSLGMDSKVIDNVGDLKDFEKISASFGENIFQFIEKYCRKRQVLLSTDNNGNIVLQRSGDEVLPNKLLHEINGKNNNILSAVSDDNDSERFNKVVVISQGNPSITPSSVTDVLPKVDNSGTAFDSTIRSSRTLGTIAENSVDNNTAKQRANWEVNIRRSRGFEYSCRTQGFTYNGKDIWQPNKIVHVIDDYCDINAQLLIRSVTFDISIGGSFTDLELVTQDAYTLAPEESAREKKANKKGAAFSS
jgi:prophage tail gpP-like protein